MSIEFNIFYVRDKNIDGHRGHILSYRTLDDIYEMYDCTVKVEYICVTSKHVYIYILYCKGRTTKHVYASQYNI